MARRRNVWSQLKRPQESQEAYEERMRRRELVAASPAETLERDGRTWRIVRLPEEWGRVSPLQEAFDRILAP